MCRRLGKRKPVGPERGPNAVAGICYLDGLIQEVGADRDVEHRPSFRTHPNDHQTLLTHQKHVRLVISERDSAQSSGRKGG